MRDGGLGDVMSTLALFSCLGSALNEKEEAVLCGGDDDDDDSVRKVHLPTSLEDFVSWLSQVDADDEKGLVDTLERKNAKDLEPVMEKALKYLEEKEVGIRVECSC